MSDLSLLPEVLASSIAAPAPRSPAVSRVERSLRVLGIEIQDLTSAEAVALLESMITEYEGVARSVFFVNAHTLNVACEQPSYAAVLNSAEAVFGDGTGVRWAARLQGRRLKANLNGTDLLPEFLEATASRGYRYFLLGADVKSIRKAAAAARERFPGWGQVGYHHGFVQGSAAPRVVDIINRTNADLLLVGMGNPLQERWIADQRRSLAVPLCIGVGGLFDHWAGNLRRAPAWVRARGCEWLQLLCQQPHKFRRYALGNPRFLYRILRERMRTGRLR